MVRQTLLRWNEKGLTVGDEQGANGSDKTHTVYGKNGVTVYGKDGQSAVGLTTKNENGKKIQLRLLC